MTHAKVTNRARRHKCDEAFIFGAGRHVVRYECESPQRAGCGVAAARFGCAMNAARRINPGGAFNLLWSERYRQHFHDRNDPVLQSQHVFLNGSNTSKHAAPRVLEIGFGLGLNFRTTLLDCLARGVPLQYQALEHDPQPVAQLSESAMRVGHTDLLAWQQLLKQWPQSPSRARSPGVELEVRIEDATSATLPQSWASAIYLDGFSSSVNGELWTDDFIAKLSCCLQPGGWLSTYSAAGHVRRALQAAGLVVDRAPGWGSKREFLRAQRPLSSLTPPG